MVTIVQVSRSVAAAAAAQSSLDQKMLAGKSQTLDFPNRTLLLPCQTILTPL